MIDDLFWGQRSQILTHLDRKTIKKSSRAVPNDTEITRRRFTYLTVAIYFYTTKLN